MFLRKSSIAAIATCTLALCLIQVASLSAQVRVMLTINSGQSETTCVDGQFGGDGEPHWQIRVNNQAYTTYPSLNNCFTNPPYVQFDETYLCPSDLPTNLQVCFRAFENDGTGCIPGYECLEQVCETIALPPLNGQLSDSIAISNNGTHQSWGRAHFTIEVSGNFDQNDAANDLICDAIHLGRLNSGQTLGNALLSNYNNFCAGSLRDPNPWAGNQNQGVWFSFTTSILPASAIRLDLQSDPESIGDQINLQAALYQSADDSCSGNLNLIQAETSIEPDGDLTMIFDCLDPLTTYFLLVDGERTVPLPAGDEGYFGLQLTDDGRQISGIDSITACNFHTWIDNKTYKSSEYGITVRIPNGAVNGCDSLATLDLTILRNAIGVENKTACGSYTWIDGNTYTESTDSAVHVLPNASVNGCDSIVTLHLTIFCPIPGCTDPTALNYDSTANFNNGSCLYGPACLEPEGLTVAAVRTRSADLSWTCDQSATYILQGNVVGRNVPIRVEIPAGCNLPFRANGLTAGLTYWWQVLRVCNGGTDTGWSAIDTFSTTCLSPDSLWESNVTRMGATLNWSKVQGVAGYEIRARLVGGSLVSLNVNGANNTSKNVNGFLQPSTSYEWQIRSRCADGSLSDLTPFNQFTTPANRAKRAGEDDGNFPQLEVLPNPASGSTKIKMENSDADAKFDLQLHDLRGRLMTRQQLLPLQLYEGYSLSLADLPEGVYLLQIRSNKGLFKVKRLIVSN